MISLKRLLATSILLIFGHSSANAFTLDRTFNNGSISVDMTGNLTPTLTHQDAKFSYLYGDPRAFGYFGTMQDVLKNQNRQETDKRLRLMGVDDSSLHLSLSQFINRQATFQTSLGVWHSPDSGALFVGDASFINRDLGSLTFSYNGDLPTRAVGVTYTYNLLDDRAGSTIMGHYSKLPNTDIQGYYAFSGLPDASNLGLKEGYGAMVSHQHSFGAGNNLTLLAGYSKGKHYNNAFGSLLKDKGSLMLGANYAYYDWTLALDGGISKSDYQNGLIKHSKTKATGIRIGYDITPRLNGYAYYGIQKTKAHELDDLPLTYEMLLEYADSMGRVAVQEGQFFKQINQNKVGLGLSYIYHQNIAFNAGIDQDNIKYKLSDGDFAKAKATNYMLGVSLSF